MSREGAAHDSEAIEKELRVLLLEDDSNDAELIMIELQRGRVAHVAQCVSSKEGFLAALAEFKPDLILSDYKLSGFTGTDALVLARQQHPDLPFILVTGALGEELAVETIKRGATDYILKHRLAELVPAMLRAVREAEQCNQRRQAEKLLQVRNQQLTIQNEQLQQVQRQLEASRERYALLYDSAPTGYTTLDEEGIIYEINSTAAQMLGKEAAQLIGTSFRQFVSPAGDARFLAHLAACPKAEGRLRTELTLLVKGGTGAIVELCSVSNQGSERQPRLYQTIITDITERKRVEAVLRESEERFRQLTETIREVFWMTDSSKNQMIYISPAYEQIWGRTCESLYASPRAWLEAIHPEDRQRVLEAALTKQLLGQYDEEYRVVRPDGCIRWIQDRAFPIRDGFGEVYRIAGIAEDITARKAAEEGLRKAEANYRGIFENAMEGIFQTTPEGRYLSVNPTLAKGLGYSSPEEMIASITDIGRQVCVEPQSRSELMRRLEAEGQVRDFENEIRDKQGNRKWVRISARAARDPSGHTLYYEGTSEDITERKLSEARITTLAQAVESTSEMICITDA